MVCTPRSNLEHGPTLNLIPILTLIRDEVRFDVRLMQRVPYEGVSRMQTSLRRKHRDRVVRRGLALIIESDCVRPQPTSNLRPSPSPKLHPCLRLCARACRAASTPPTPAANTSPTSLTSIRYWSAKPCRLSPVPLRSRRSPRTDARPSLCCAASRRPATSTRSTRELPRLKPATPSIKAPSCVAPYRGPLDAQVPLDVQLRLQCPAPRSNHMP